VPKAPKEKVAKPEKVKAAKPPKPAGEGGKPHPPKQEGK